jgi:hypothetical protein
MKVRCFSFLLAFGVSSVAGFSIAGNRKSPAARKIQTTTSLSNVWSDPKAVKGYQDFLESGEQELTLKRDGPSAIVYGVDGANELAENLWAMGMGDDVVLTPGQALPLELGGNAEYPIYITVPPNQLQSFLSNLSDDYKNRWEDFVFFSGGLSYGNIEDILKENGLCRDTMTQAIMTGFEKTPSGSFKDLSTRLGADAVGEEKWAGECAACGKWHGAIAERLERNAIRCSIDFYRDWRRKMWERNILDAIFNLVGVVRQEPTSIANVAQYYESEVSDMVWEISSQLRGWKGMALMYGFEERLFGFAENTGAEKPCMLIDELYPWIWGNRVFTEAPTVLSYLWYAKQEFGLLQNVELPPQKGENDVKSTIMRQGNMRANGVI